MASVALPDFEAVIEQLLSRVRTSHQDNAVMQFCLKTLDKIMKDLDARWRVRPFGSAANGFCTRFSDLDVTCFQDPNDGLPCATATETISLLHPLLQEHSSFEVLEVITSARIPLLKTRFEKKLEVDISFQNTDPLANTQLLRAYAELNILVRHVAILVKLWAKSVGVCGAQNGHLSSYSLTLMVIYCLQIDDYVKLPCLPTDAYSAGGKKTVMPKLRWQCQAKLSELLMRFFAFYATDFCWGYEVVSPRLGRRLYASDEQFSELAGRDSSLMVHIEDPYLLGRNLSCVLGQTQQHLLMTRICDAHLALSKQQVPLGFLSALNSKELVADGTETQPQVSRKPAGYQNEAVTPSNRMSEVDGRGNQPKLAAQASIDAKTSMAKGISAPSDMTPSGSSDSTKSAGSQGSSWTSSSSESLHASKSHETHAEAPLVADVPVTRLMPGWLNDSLPMVTELVHGTTWSL